MAEPAAPRPEAAVRGITPQQPAPMPAPRLPAPAPAPAEAAPVAAPAEGQSIIGKIFGWFKRKPADEPRPRPPRRRRSSRGRPAAARPRTAARPGAAARRAARARRPAAGRRPPAAGRAAAAPEGGQQPQHQGQRERDRDGGRRRPEQERHGERRDFRRPEGQQSHVASAKRRRADAQPQQPPAPQRRSPGFCQDGGEQRHGEHAKGVKARPAAAVAADGTAMGSASNSGGGQRPERRRTGGQQAETRRITAEQPFERGEHRGQQPERNEAQPAAPRAHAFTGAENTFLLPRQKRTLPDSEHDNGRGGIVKVADEIVREDYRSAPPVHTPVPAPVPPRARCRACPGSRSQACPAAGRAGVAVGPGAGRIRSRQGESRQSRLTAEDAAPRPRRERPARPPVAEEPLVQIETGAQVPGGGAAGVELESWDRRRLRAASRRRSALRRFTPRRLTVAH